MVTNRRMQFAGSLVALVLPLMGLSGCATKGYVQKEIAAARSYTDERVTEARARADEAWAKASLAERLSSGDYSEVSMHQVQFAFDDYQLSPDNQALLDALAAEVAQHPRYGLEIRGYADGIGTNRYNLRLGRERADEVLRYLMMRHNVVPSRVALVSFGEEQPVADNETEDGRAQNRRVQVRLLEIKTTTEQPVSTIPAP